jgi:DNA-binding MarR family transcriptional regulator
MTASSRATAAGTLQRIFEILVKEFDRDCPVNQPYAFVRVANAGEAGLDQARLQDDMQLSSAGISRLVQALSKVSYQKDREGFDVIERRFDARDNRFRSLVLTSKGERVLNKLIDALTAAR